MVDAKTRLVALAVLAGVGLSGCELNQKDPNYPDSIAPTTFTALFLDTSNVPWPNDLLFNGTKDLTLNIPAPLNAPGFFEDFFDAQQAAVKTFWREVNQRLALAAAAA